MSDGRRSGHREHTCMIIETTVIDDGRRARGGKLANAGCSLGWTTQEYSTDETRPAGADVHELKMDAVCEGYHGGRPMRTDDRAPHMSSVPRRISSTRNWTRGNIH